MGNYQYTAKERSGRTIKGLIEAASESEVAEALHKKELLVLSVSLTRGQGRKANPRGSTEKVKLEDIVIFARQLATMIDSGIPLVHALNILAEQVENKGLKVVVTTMLHDIEAGMSFCDALAKHPKVFSEFFVNMVRAGETSGLLDDVLDRLATYLEKSAALSRKIRASLIYPAVVVSMSMLITAVLLLKVVPVFKGIFTTLGGTLPMPTMVLIVISDALRKYFLVVVVFVGGASFLLKHYITTPKGRYRFDVFKLKVLVVGPLFRKIAVAKFSRTFSTLVKSGVSVLGALEIVSKTSGNKVIEEAVVSCSTAVRNGEPISQPLAKTLVFPPMVTRMISVGEQTGKLELMLSKIADFYDEQVDVAATALTSMIEPLVICFLGIAIGGIVIALFLPVFKVSTLIAK